MIFQKYCKQLFFITFLLVFGCSSSDDGPGYRIYQVPDSDLRLLVPDSLGVTDNLAAEVHYFAEQVPHCFRSDSSPIDIVLAEASIFYFLDYLYPDYFPDSLDTIATAEDYVDYLRVNDKFTFILLPQEYAYHKSIRDGDRALIGVRLNFSGQRVTADTPLIIEEISFLYSAWVDGFKPGDKIIAIDGVSITGMDEEGVLSIFPKTEGKKATFTVERGAETIDIQTAAEEHIGRLLRPDLAYLNARSFTLNTGEEVRKDFEELVDASSGTIDKLILDLRDNTGGSVLGAWELVDYLIDEDDGEPIMTYKFRDGATLIEYLGEASNYNIENFDDTNFVLLIDGYSASSSEITTAALMYYDTVTSMGWKTYGKGVGQVVVELLDGSAVWITALEIWGPSGASWHLTGISPDYVFERSPESFDSDLLIDAAIEFLDTGIPPVEFSSGIMRESARQLDGRTHDVLVEKMREKSRGWF